jgi:hypothetical protein
MSEMPGMSKLVFMLSCFALCCLASTQSLPEPNCSIRPDAKISKYPPVALAARIVSTGKIESSNEAALVMAPQGRNDLFYSNRSYVMRRRRLRGKSALSLAADL